MPLAGTTNLPVAPRNHRWNPVAAKKRVLESCGGNVACIGRAFLWRDPSVDARTPEAWSLGIADYIDGQLHIVPKALAAAAGLRGIGSMTFDCDEDSTLVVERLGEVYEAVRKVYDDWPRSPFYVPPAAVVPALKADASGQGIEGIIAVEGLETGDGRFVKPGALTWEELPVPLVFDRDEMDHSGATVGTINAIERREDGVIFATGNLSETEDPATAAMVSRVAELFSEGAVGVSMSLDNIVEEEGENGLLTITAGRIRSVAIVDEAAFAPAKMSLAASVNAQAEWFSDPSFTGEDDPRLVWQDAERAEEDGQYGCPLTVTDEGQVYGHIALWGRCHVGYPGTCVRPPREPAAYRNFMSGERIPGIPTGPLVMRTTHAPNHVNADGAKVHYDHTGFAVADVSIGPDDYGIWCAGALRPGVSPEDIEILRASALSGDWRLIGGQHRLIGVLVCSAPGFRIARAIAASGVLITSGPGCKVCDDVPLEERVARLELALAQMQVSA